MMRTVLVAAAMLLGIGSVVAQQDLVNQRQSLMKANGRNMGTVLSATAKGDKPYDQAAIDAALAQLEDSAKKMATLYPDSTKGLKADTLQWIRAMYQPRPDYPVDYEPPHLDAIDRPGRPGEAQPR